MISFLLHALLLLFLAKGKIPFEKSDIQEPSLNSYIIFKPRPKPEPEPEPEPEPKNPTIEVAEDAIEKIPPLAEISANVETPQITNENTIKSTATLKETESLTNSELEKPELNLQSSTSLFFENANKQALHKISRNALNDYHQPKPLVDPSRLSVAEQIQKDLNESFAPLGTDITVISQLGDETLILNSGTCFRVVQTALDDKVHRGASVWNLATGCGSVDKYDEQLQISLDKYLKK